MCRPLDVSMGHFHDGKTCLICDRDTSVGVQKAIRVSLVDLVDDMKLL